MKMSFESGEEKNFSNPSDFGSNIGDSWRTPIREVLDSLPPLSRRLLDRVQITSQIVSLIVSQDILDLVIAIDTQEEGPKQHSLKVVRQGKEILGSCPECQPNGEVLLADGCSHLLGGVSSLLVLPQSSSSLEEKPVFRQDEYYSPPYRSTPRPFGAFLINFGTDWGFLMRTGVRSALTESFYRDWQNRFRLPGSTARPEFKFWRDFHNAFYLELIWESPKGRFPIFFPKPGFPWFAFVQEGRIPVFRPSGEDPLVPLGAGTGWSYEGDWIEKDGKSRFSGCWKSLDHNVPAYQTLWREKKECRILLTDREIIDLTETARFPESLKRFLEKGNPEHDRRVEEWGELIALALSLSAGHVRFRWNGSPIQSLFELTDQWEPRLDTQHSSLRGIRIFPHLFASGIKIPLFGPERNLQPDILFRTEGERVRILRRDRQSELFMRNVVERGLRKASTESWIHLSPVETLSFWAGAWKELEKGGFRNGEMDTEDGTLLMGPGIFRVFLSLGKNEMVRAEGALIVEGKTFPLPVVDLASQDPFVRLDENDRMILDRESLEQVDAINGLFQLGPDGVGNISIYAATLITLHRPDLSIEIGEDLRGKLSPFVPAPLSEEDKGILSEEFRGTLRGYQLEGVAWMRSLHSNGLPGILADEMGLGKTITALAFLLLMRGKGDKGELPALLVVPASLVYNWEKEIRTFAPSLSFVLHHGSGRKSKGKERKSAQLWITTYGTVRNDLEILKDQEFSVMILDEAQTIKNPDSAIFRAVSSIRSQQRIAMTGTPIENHLLDLWSLFHFLLPGLLGTRRFFEERYVQGKGGSLWSEKRVLWLKALVSPLILRRTKKDVLKELPPKMHIDHWVLPEDEERYAYRMILERGREELLSSSKERGPGLRMNMLALLMKLRLFCCHPDLVLGEGQSRVPSPSKFLSVMEKMREALEEGHRVLLFSQFTRMLDILERQLVQDGIPFYRLDGETPLVERKRRVELFQNEDPDRPGVFLSSLKAGGVGFTLTNADFVFHYDPWWNPQVENQATDRAHRIGQSRSVFVYRFVTRGTVEEKVMALKQEKLELFDQMMEGQTVETSSWISKQLESLLDMGPAELHPRKG